MAKDWKTLAKPKPAAAQPPVPDPTPAAAVGDEPDRPAAGLVELPDPPAGAAEAPATEPEPRRGRRAKAARYRVQFPECPPFVCEAADGDAAVAACKAAYGVLGSRTPPTVEETDLPLTDL